MQGHSLVAIGGIDETRFGDVLGCGVGSIAVVRALVASDKPETAAKQLMQRMMQPEHPPT
jgi:thiamine-phosphate pyrophosphorylase